MENNRAYYAIIPANVRYDKNLKDKAKLLYGEITALCNEKGYCWASNDYFAELYGVSKTTISTLIRNLIENGYITSQIIYKEGSKQILHRYLRIVKEGIEENLNTPIEENLNSPIKENLKDNNTLINNTSINNTNNNNNNTSETRSKRFVPPTVEEVIDYCNERQNNVNPAQFVDYYTANDWKVGRNKMKDWKASVRTWERNSYSNSRQQQQPKQSGNPFFDLLREEGKIQ